MKSKPVALTATSITALVLLVGGLTACSNTAAPEATPNSALSASPSPTVAVDPKDDSIKNALAYIIEEEKLAYDVYTVLGEMWNLRTMQNIMKSEATHQSRVQTLLTTYGVTDPRSSEIGVFANPELQKLYDNLIAQGSVSAQEAIQVGITIEKTDIADIDEMLSDGLPDDVVAVLEALRSGSLNHLAAFERQV